MFTTALLAAWFVIASPHFELVTDTNERIGNQVLADLENARLALAGPYGTPLPVRCFLFRRPSDFAAYRPTPITLAFFQSGPDRDYLVASLDGFNRIPREALIHEYVHLYLHHTTAALPKWADEGLAEYYSTMEFSAGRAKVGTPVARHLPTLTRGPWLSAAEMARVTPDSPEYSDEASASRFYAQAWAAIHSYASRNNGRPSLKPEPFSEENLTTYLADYRATRTKPAIFLWSLDQLAPSTETHSLADANAALLQIDLLLRLSKHDEAQQLLQEVEHRLPPSATIERGLALVAAGRGNHAEATRRFERSLESPDADADTFFEYAVYLENRGTDRSRVSLLLAEATKRNPNHAEAQFLQGRMLARARRHREAIAYFERAIQILPREPLFRAALDASKEALRSKPADEPRQDVRLPDSWKMPVADTKLSGTLERVDCQQDLARIHIRAAGAIRQFELQAADRLQLRGASGAQIELSCGQQPPGRTVDLEFVKATGVVTALTFAAQ